MSRPLAAVARLLARAAGVEDPKVDWRQLDDGPWFDNQVATLDADGRSLVMRLEKAVPVDGPTAGSSASSSAAWPERRNSGPPGLFFPSRP